MAFGGGGKGPKNEINVTPLVDVVLVLLIIFMVITPMLQRGKDVHLPVAHKPDEENKQADPVIFSMTKERKLFYESKEIPLDDLQGAIETELRGNPGRKLVLKGDDSLTVGDVRRIFLKMQNGGARGVALGVEEAKK